MQDDAADVVTNVARKFLTAMSVKPVTGCDGDPLWQKIESIVDHRSDSGKQYEEKDVPRSTSALWASAGGTCTTTHTSAYSHSGG